MTQAHELTIVGQPAPRVEGRKSHGRRQPNAKGAKGIVHGADFLITDYDLAVTSPAAAMAMTVVDLLGDDGEAQRVVDGFTPALSKEAYLELQRGFNRRVTYED